MKVGYLGGAFDPIHNDHINTAITVLENKLVDRVMLMPCYRHKFEKEMASFEDRYEMVSLAALEARREGYDIYPTAVEEWIGHSGSTYDLFTSFLIPEQGKLGNKCYCIIGADNARSIDKWHEWQKLIAQLNFIVVERKDDKQTYFNEWYKQEPHQYISSCVGDLSSTVIREAVKANKPYENMVSKSTFNHIKYNGLYI